MTVALPPARPVVQPDMVDDRQHRRQLARAVGDLTRGHGNTSIYVTLDASVATTTVIDARISAQTCAAFMPQTANAAAENPTLYVVCTDGQMVVHHTNNALTDRTFTVGLTG